MQDIINQLDQEIERLNAAKALLQGGTTSPLQERPKKRIMSAKARKAIAAAQKARWAKHKKTTI